MSDALRLLVALVVVGLLVRTVRPAWRHRELALAIWSSIRPRHLAGSLLLLAVVASVLLALLTFVPVSRIGLGSLVGISGNAVFAPVEEVTSRAGGEPVPDGRPQAARGVPLAAIGLFLLALATLFPWLAYVEERVFREGLEDAGLGRELWAALRFGLAHLVMLVPLAAALAIAVAGFAYGRVYRSAYARTGARHDAVLAATVWHTSFNSLLVIAVFAGVVLGL